MRKVTLDIETEGDFRTNGDFGNLEVTIACIHDSETDEFKSFLKPELSGLWPILEQADLIIGYNSDHFDIPILNKYYAGDLSKIRSVDLLKEIKNAFGRRLKLDSVAEGTLGKKKSGHGLDAVQWWKEGKVDKVRQYCIDDVRITRDIYDYARKNGSIKYRDFDGIREIKLDTSKWEEGGPAAITHTLPF
ncbi:MAG: ribonuclease H-like domain-containing protein [Candidatus Pacebacteria bacterium]|nr:ribonuclease H-like domain-containing protein [Candidatus Paceibacterota bacterium]